MTQAEEHSNMEPKNFLEHKEVEFVDENVTATPASEEEEGDRMTPKTWLVIFFLSWQYGMSFWQIPFLSTIGGRLATHLGDPSDANWYSSSNILAMTIAFMLCGANSDLFGRRNFILAGNLICMATYFVIGSAKTSQQIIIGMSIHGFGAGLCQIAMYALPELMPNKWRHVGVVIADLWVFLDVLVGPTSARLCSVEDNSWRWNFYTPGIAQGLCFIGLAFLYYPPKHPRGVPWMEAVRDLDYVGMVLFVAGGTLTLVGVVLTSYISASDARVVATLTVGLVTLAIFGVWETVCEKHFHVKYALCPRRVFIRNKGRDMTAPWIVMFTITMFYYYINIVWGTAVNVWWATSPHEAVALGLVPNVGLVAGGLALMFFGSSVRHFKMTQFAATFLTVLFGALMALAEPERKASIIAFTVINQFVFGWALYLACAYTQLGVEHIDLGVSGGLAGVARYGGGSVATSVYTTVLGNVQRSKMASLVPKAATAAGLPASSVPSLLAAIPSGSKALAKVPGVTDKIVAAATSAYNQSYSEGIKMTALTSLAFGILAIAACIYCSDVEERMTNKVEVFLENDKNAEKNKYH